MRLSWNRAEDGVVTVYATSTDGRCVEIADFWLTPLIDKFGMQREPAKWMQQNFAELLISVHNRHFNNGFNDDAASGFECPLHDPKCRENCGAYGCGN